MMVEERKESRPFPVIFSLFMLIVSVVFVYTIMSNGMQFTKHSKTSHPAAISKIEKCFDGGGTLSPIFKMGNGRWSQYCNDGSNNNYWRVMECEEGGIVVVTQFKQALRKLQNYIQNHNMSPVEVINC